MRRALEEALKREGFSGESAEDFSTLSKMSRDASLFTLRPELVLYPRNAGDVSALVRAARAARSAGESLSLTPRAAGTDMTGGPLTTSVVVSFTKFMHRVKMLSGGRAEAEPGAYYRDFEKETLLEGWLMPSYPASRELCAIGGMIGNNAGGEKSLTYGKTERYVEKLNVVLSDGSECVLEPLRKEALEEKKRLQTFEGEVYRRMDALLTQHAALIERARPKVSKNSAGYALWNVRDSRGMFDLSKLFVGSQGTLGIVTKAQFSLVRPVRSSRMLVIFLNDLSLLAKVIQAVLAEKPESFESYDDKTLKIAIQYFKDIAKRLKGDLFSLAWRFLPEFWTVLTRGVPKLILTAEFRGASDREAYELARRAEAALAGLSLKTRITKNERESEKYWAVRRESFNLLRLHTRGKRTAPFIDDIVVSPEKLPVFLPKLYAILDECDIVYTIAGHVGDGNFHIIPLLNFRDPKTVPIIEELTKRVYALVFSYKGSMTGEHNDGLIRSPFLKEMYGVEVYKLFEETKQIFDPDNLFNPGKKIGSSLAYAEEHIVKES